MQMELLSKGNSSYLIKFTKAVKAAYLGWKFLNSCCELCHGSELVHPLLCRHCLADLPYFNIEQCQYDLLLWPAINTLFPRRYFDRLLSLTPYIWPTNNWLKQLKYHNRFELADLLGFLLNSLWQQQANNKATSVLCVPNHINKWQERGFNQAHLIAKAFSQYANLTYLPDAILRITDDISQVNQSGKQRRQNLKHAFKLANVHQLLPNEVLIIDDVMTTGSTMNAISRLLRQHGVEKITILTVALTLPKATAV